MDNIGREVRERENWKRRQGGKGKKEGGTREKRSYEGRGSDSEERGLEVMRMMREIIVYLGDRTLLQYY